MTIYEIIKDKFLNKTVEISVSKFVKKKLEIDNVITGEITDIFIDGDGYSGYSFCFVINNKTYDIDYFNNDIKII